MIQTQEWVDFFNAWALPQWNVRLVGGFEEPLYLPAEENRPAEIQFTRDFLRSAFHELSHWCIAGEERRQLRDYGYWYRPDGRNAQQQEEFFRVEVKPQTIEREMTRLAGLEFEASLDNLSGEPMDVSEFERRLDEQLAFYQTQGFPSRAERILNWMKTTLTVKQNETSLE